MSAQPRGRRPGHARMIRLPRGDRSVIVAVGLSRTAAEHIVEVIQAQPSREVTPLA